METDVTIISPYLSKKIISNYSDYVLIEKINNLEEIFKYSKVIFWNALNNFNEDIVKEVYDKLRKEDIKFINVTNNEEEILFTKYLIIKDKEKTLIEGLTMDVLKEEKVFKRLGLKLPFLVELSYYLKDYNLIDKVYLDYQSLEDALWN